MWCVAWRGGACGECGCVVVRGVHVVHGVALRGCVVRGKWRGAWRGDSWPPLACTGSDGSTSSSSSIFCSACGLSHMGYESSQSKPLDEMGWGLNPTGQDEGLGWDGCGFWMRSEPGQYNQAGLASRKCSLHWEGRKLHWFVPRPPHEQQALHTLARRCELTQRRRELTLIGFGSHSSHVGRYPLGGVGGSGEAAREDCAETMPPSAFRTNSSHSPGTAKRWQGRSVRFVSGWLVGRRVVRFGSVRVGLVGRSKGRKVAW